MDNMYFSLEISLLIFYCKTLFHFNLELFRSGLLSFVWGLLNDLQSLTILSLVSINVTGIARLINKSIIAFSQLDILPTDLIYDSVFTFDDSDDQPVNGYFD